MPTDQRGLTLRRFVNGVCRNLIRGSKAGPLLPKGIERKQEEKTSTEKSSWSNYEKMKLKQHQFLSKLVLAAKRAVVVFIKDQFMKKWILIGSALILVLLAIRAYKNHVDGVQAERRSYIRELNFDFSGVVDTVTDHGHLLFHVTGSMDRGREKTLNAELHFNGMLDLFLYKDNQLELMLNGAHLCRRGDSVYVNSDQNIVKVFRKKKLVVRGELINSIRGRPF